jgi:hypothetical protein
MRKSRAASLIPFLERALAPKPEDRFATIVEFESALLVAIGRIASEEQVAEYVSSLFANQRANAIDDTQRWHRQYGNAVPRAVTLPGHPVPVIPSGSEPKRATLPTLRIDRAELAAPARPVRRQLVTASCAMAAVGLLVVLAMASRRSERPVAPPPLPHSATPSSRSATTAAIVAPVHADSSPAVDREPPRRNVAATRSASPPRSCAQLAEAEDALFTGRYDDAVHLASTCIKRNSAVSAALVVRAQAQMASGKPEAAGTDVRRALDVDPTNVKARRLLENLERQIQ